MNKEQIIEICQKYEHGILHDIPDPDFYVLWEYIQSAHIEELKTLERTIPLGILRYRLCQIGVCIMTITTYDDLELVLEFLNSIDDINDGGCGVAALAIIRWLKQTKNKKAKPVYLDNDDFPPVGRAPNHVSVKINDDDYVDTTGHNASGHPAWWEYSRPVREASLIKALNNRGTWKDDFNREQWLPVIEIELNVDLSDVEI